MNESDERYERGLRNLKTLNAGAPDRLAAVTQGVAPDLARYTIEYGYGDVFNRPGLDRRTRQIITVAVLATLGNAAPQLRSHIRGALNVGVSREEIAEIMIQLSVYAGFPAALNGTGMAREVFKTLDEESESAAE
jgi:4-carboxymuconolactone decarboxylase